MEEKPGVRLTEPQQPLPAKQKKKRRGRTVGTDLDPCILLVPRQLMLHGFTRLLHYLGDEWHGCWAEDYHCGLHG